jgi:hypothetical protein
MFFVNAAEGSERKQERRLKGTEKRISRVQNVGPKDRRTSRTMS